eukprot:TRINITY_DN106115_c0_g1_i1.p1 TRINITY_DN106115_c0_g1~~TRINITY_DN106115_c0_g1_i1.p1  ORF type:complete len:428 (-),score=67.08 TRINITY_DN106115_c0_g1_i1:74-1357(-)
MESQPKDLGEIGEMADVPMLLVPMPGVPSELVDPAGYTVKISKTCKLVGLKDVLKGHLGQEIGVMLTDFVYDGNDLNSDLTLKENNVPLPGPAARRAGEKVKLIFDLQRNAIEAMHEQRYEIERKLKLEEQRQIERHKAEEKRRKEEEEAKLRFIEESKGLQTWVETNIGFSLAMHREMEAACPPAFMVGGRWDVQHHLELCNSQQMQAMSLLLERTGARGYKILAAYRNDNARLRRNYEAAKSRMQMGTKHIRRRPAATAVEIQKDRQSFACLGEYDLSINEFPLWHGTPTTSGACGICGSGFDINFVGTTTDSGWYGPGFYFSDSAEVSVGYAGLPHRVNSQFPTCHIMLLSRVVIGNIRVQDRIADDDQLTRDRVTAECFGPGGVFGPASSFHSLLGQGNEYVCMSSQQIYPEYVIIYTTMGGY